MADFYAIARPFLMAMAPETAHRLSLWALRYGFVGQRRVQPSPMLGQRLWGMDWPNPVGLAAGFDKDAEAIAPLLGLGFGFVEVGTVTPEPQPGNPKPRVFRVRSLEAIINRMGFPSKGVQVFHDNVAACHERHPDLQGYIGINIGKNKETEDAAVDYAKGIGRLAGLADYLVVNVSSPNTPGLRGLQAPEQLERLLDKCLEARDEAVNERGKRPPLLVKLAPDLEAEQRHDIAGVVRKSGIDGLVISNTTISRPDDWPANAPDQTGGLSGSPLRDMARRVIADMYRLTEGALPIIGVGGIASAEDAYMHIRAGASLIQLYTGLVYKGPGLPGQIVRGLPSLLARDGFTSITDAVGADAGLNKTVADKQKKAGAG